MDVTSSIGRERKGAGTGGKNVIGHWAIMMSHGGFATGLLFVAYPFIPGFDRKHSSTDGRRIADGCPFPS